MIHLFDHAIDSLEPQVEGIRLKSFHLTNAVDGDRFDVRPRSPDLVQTLGLEGRKVILTLCRISKADGENKGYRRVLDALPQVLQVVTNLTYVLAGGGDDLEDVRELVRNKGLASHVVLPGPLPAERLVEYFNLADLFVLPSKIEGFPAIVLLEALACGVPVVGGNQPGSERALLDGELGWVVPHDDVAGISDSLIRALQSPPPAWVDRNALREKALSIYGKQQFSSDAARLACRIAEIVGQ